MYDLFYGVQYTMTQRFVINLEYYSRASGVKRVFFCESLSFFLSFYEQQKKKKVPCVKSTGVK